MTLSWTVSWWNEKHTTMHSVHGGTTLAGYNAVEAAELNRCCNSKRGENWCSLSKGSYSSQTKAACCNGSAMMWIMGCGWVGVCSIQAVARMKTRLLSFLVLFLLPILNLWGKLFYSNFHVLNRFNGWLTSCNVNDSVHPTAFLVCVWWWWWWRGSFLLPL